MKLDNLDQTVLKALDFFIKNPPPTFKMGDFNLPFVVGSGNAFNTGKIIFSGRAAIFANESDYRSIVKSYKPIVDKGLISKALVISSSGEKDSVWEVEFSQESGLETTLMTCDGDSSAAKIAGQVLVYRSLPEPYTYNTSTYMGMILSCTKEKPMAIKKLIEKINLPQNFGDYEAYSFILPDKYLHICPMLDIKKSELFGPYLSLRAFTQGHARHAKFVHRWEKELVISIGQANQYFGHPDHRWEIDYPKDLSFGGMLALTYYLTGKVQAAKPSYFKKNIEAYCKSYGPQAYGKKTPLAVIVPGN